MQPKLVILGLILLFAYNAFTATVIQFSGGGAAAMSVQSSLTEKLVNQGRLSLENADVYCVSGGCGTAVLVDRLGPAGAVKFMQDIRRQSDAVDRHWLLSTFVLKKYDGIYNFDPLKKRMRKAIAGKPKTFRSLTMMVTDYDEMKTKYIETSNLSDEKLLDWVGAAKAVPMLVESFQGKYVDSAIINSFAKQPVFDRPDFQHLTMWILNSHLHRLPERNEKTAAENGERMLTHTIAQDNNRDIVRIKDEMFAAGNHRLHVYSMSKPISTFKYDRDNIGAGLKHGAELKEITHDDLHFEFLEAM